MEIIRGKVWKFGDDINTDLIAPGKYMSAPMDEMKLHVLEISNPSFAGEVADGDIIVGGSNFGCGSSREEAPAVLKACGVSAVIAESFARIFFRNAIAIGLPAITCRGISDIVQEGNQLTLDVDASSVTVNGKTVTFDELPEEIRDVLAKGGILPMLKEIAANQQ